METLVVSDDSENRITIGGKRKSSGRRSSILKATKSPLKGGALEDLDPNSLDNETRSKSKKSRHSSGRRVSFAEKNEIKEFFVEDWQSAWKKEVEKNNLQLPSDASQSSEYKEPTESIKGLDSLLKGDIQENHNQEYRVELQNMPEVQFSQISEANEDSMINYGRGVLLQTVAPEEVWSTEPLDVTVCHGGIVSADSYFNIERRSTSPRQQLEEMQYTACYNSDQMFQNAAPNMDPGDQTFLQLEEMQYTACYNSDQMFQNAAPNMDPGDQTRIFGGDEDVELDVTCSQQEIFFRDFPNAPLSSPTCTNLEESGKRDSSSFLMSLKSNHSSSEGNELSPSSSEEMTKMDGKFSFVSLKSKPASFQGDEITAFTSGENTQKRDSTSFLVSLKSKSPSFPDNEITSSNPEQSSEMENRSFLVSLKSKPSSFQGNEVSCAIRSRSQRQPLGEITGIESSMAKTQSVGLSETLQQDSQFDDNVELTTCHSYGFHDNSAQRTNRRSICESADMDVTSCIGLGLVKASEKQVTSERALHLDSNPGAASYSTHNLPSTYHAVRGQTVDYQAQRLPGETANLDMTSCYGGGILPVKQSLVAGIDQTTVFNTESEDIDSLDFAVCQGQDAFTTFSGSTLHAWQGESLNVASRKMDSSAFLRSLREAKEGSLSVPSVGDKMDITICQPSVTAKLTASKNSLVIEHQADQELHEAVDQLDITNCYGSGILPNEKSLTTGADKTVVFEAHTGNANSLDFTICRGQDAFSSFPYSTQQNVQHALPSAGSNKVDSSVFLRSLREGRSTDADSNSDEICDEMDLTATHGSTMCNEIDSCIPGQNGRQTDKTSGQNDYVESNVTKTGYSRTPMSASPGKTTERQAASDGWSGTQQNDDDNLEFTSCHSFQVLDSNMQKSKRRSIYEVADIDVTSCYDPGLSRSPGKQVPGSNTKENFNLTRGVEDYRINDSIASNRGQELPSQGIQRQSDETMLELKTCHSQDRFDKDAEKTNGIQEPARQSSPTDVKERKKIESFFLSFNLKPSSAKEKEVSSIAIGNTSLTKQTLSDNTNITGSTAILPGDGWNGTQHQEESRLDDDIEMTTCCSFGLLDNIVQKARRKSSYEPVDMDVTSYHGQGIVKPPLKEIASNSVSAILNLTRSREAAACRAGDSTALDARQVLQSQEMPEQLEESKLQLSSTCLNEEKTEGGMQKMESFHEQADNDMKSSYVTGLTSLPDEQVVSDFGPRELSLIGEAVNTAQDLQSQKMPETLEEPNTEVAAACCGDENIQGNIDNKKSFLEQTDGGVIFGLTNFPDEQVVRMFDKKQLSIIEEAEDANKTEVEESQIGTQKPITLKEFLDITKIVFITEVNTRRSIAPSIPINSTQTPKDKIVCSLVTAPKVACYEEAIQVVESQIVEMEEKVKHQEMELNASNPRVFMEAQSATKQEVFAMRTDARRLRSACDKIAAREWKEGKHQLNKEILTKLTENHQSLAADVHIVEESLSMVDDCCKLLDKMDEDLDKKINDIELCLEKNEKKLEQQAKVTEEIQAMMDALQKSEQELAEKESKRSSLQSEKQELENRKEDLKRTILDKKEALRLIKKQREEPRSDDPLKLKFELMESIPEWTLEEWNETHAKFTFFKDTVELLVLFGPLAAGEGTKNSWDQKVESIQLKYAAPEQVNSYQRKVHTLLNQSVSSEKLTQMCPTKAGLTKVFEDVSWLMYKSKAVGVEVYRIFLSHLTSFKENSLVVEFFSMKAFVKFVLSIQLDLKKYPEGVVFTVSPKIGRYSQAEIEAVLNAVKVGPWYLSRLVETADQLLTQDGKPSSSLPS